MLGTGFEPELNGAAEEVRQLRGLIPRVFDDMFTRLSQIDEQTEVQDVVSALCFCRFKCRRCPNFASM